MINPRLTYCPTCPDPLSLIRDIDCKIMELSNNLYNNTVFLLNRQIQPTVILDLINYKRILTYKYCNPDYVSLYSLASIASKVKVLTLGVKCIDCNEIVRPILTTTTTSLTPTTTTTTTIGISTTTTTTTVSCSGSHPIPVNLIYSTDTFASFYLSFSEACDAITCLNNVTCSSVAAYNVNVNSIPLSINDVIYTNSSGCDTGLTGYFAFPYGGSIYFMIQLLNGVIVGFPTCPTTTTTTTII